MYILTAKTPNGPVFYNGKAGSAWVSGEKALAFAYSTKDGAMAKVDVINSHSALHGLTFEVEPI